MIIMPMNGECQKDFASAQKLRIYIQGYVDCVQVSITLGF